MSSLAFAATTSMLAHIWAKYDPRDGTVYGPSQSGLQCPQRKISNRNIIKGSIKLMRMRSLSENECLKKKRKVDSECCVLTK